MEKRGTAPWPASQQWDYEQIINALKEDSKINKENEDSPLLIYFLFLFFFFFIL